MIAAATFCRGQIAAMEVERKWEAVEDGGCDAPASLEDFHGGGSKLLQTLTVILDFNA